MTETSAVAGLNTAFATLDPEPLLAAPPALIEFLPLAVHACDASGRTRWFNSKAAELWGRSPEIGEKAEPLGGTNKVYGLDGTIVDDGGCPLAQALRTARAPRDGR